MNRAVFLAGALVSAWGVVGVRAETVEVTSPDGRNAVRLDCDGLSYEVLRDGVLLSGKTPIDLTVDGKSLRDGAKLKSVVRSSDKGLAETPVYKKSQVDLSGNRAFADFGDWGVRLAARNDGVAYRFELNRPGRVTVTDESAPLTIPDPAATCWVNLTRDYGHEETTNKTVRASDLRTDGALSRLAYLPLTYSVGGKYVTVTESDVHDYPIWNLTRREGAGAIRLASDFAHWPKESYHAAENTHWVPQEVAKGGRWIMVRAFADYLVETEGTRTLPWRTFVLADKPMKLIEADIVYALARPAEKGADFSWVKPGKVAWDWWNDWNLEGPHIDFKAGCNTRSYEYYIDFAAKKGVEYVIFDEGWSEKLDIWKFHPDVDVPHLIRYAADRNVGIILWMAWAQVAGDEKRVAEHFARLGAKGFKVDFMDRGDAQCERFLWAFAEECRKNRMLVDYHGAHRPTGMSRAYPNVLNYEGIRGLEMMKFFKNSYDFLDNDVKEMFCRFVAGPADYTPGAMDNYPVGRYAGTSHNPGSLGTRARQVAMMVAFEAPLQMLCDTPTKYEKNAECFDFMAKVPVVWKDVRGLSGHPDAYAAVAREARDGSWYVAVLSNAQAREVELDFSFLAPGAWCAEIFRDAPESSVTPTRYVHETKAVTDGERLTVSLAPGGGFAARIFR